jgi:hypothetical protein
LQERGVTLPFSAKLGNAVILNSAISSEFSTDW